MQLYGGSSTCWPKQTGLDVNAKGPFELFGRQHELVVGLTYTKFEDHNDPNAGEDVEGRNINYYTWDNETAQPQGNGQILFDNDTTIRQLGTYAAVRLMPTDDLSIILAVARAITNTTVTIITVLPRASAATPTPSIRKAQSLAALDPGQVVVGTRNERAYVAVKGAKARGFDAEINGEVLPGWKVAASYTHAITQDADGERINMVAPAELAKFWTTYRLPGELERLTVGGGVNWQSGIHFSATPWQLGKTVKAKQDDYAVFNLMARYDFTDSLSALVNVNNLFDKKYLSSLDETFYGGYYGDPRNVMLTTRYQL